MDGSDFKNRVFYISDNNNLSAADETKPTLIFLHGNMAMFVGYTKLVQRLTANYQVVGFDIMNLGLNTRSGEAHVHKIGMDADKAENWIIE